MKFKFLSTICFTFALISNGFAFSEKTNTTADSVIEKAWLREYLPEKITAYARIPSALFYFAPTDKRLQALYENANYQPFIQAVISKVGEKISAIAISETEKLALKTLLAQITTPLEIAIGDLGDLSAPPTVYIAGKSRLNSLAEFDAFLAALIKETPITANAQAPGHGQLVTPMGNGSYHYDIDSGRFLMVIGGNKTATKALIAAKTPVLPSPIAALEAQIDASGHGLFVWVKPHPMLWSQIPWTATERQLFQSLQIEQISKLAAGMGIGDERPKIKAIINMPNVGLRQLLPSHQQAADINYFGQIASLWALSLPNENQLDKMVSLLIQEQPEAWEKYTLEKQKVERVTDMSIARLMQIFGNQAVFFEDDNGSYMSLPATAEPALIELLTHVKKNYPLLYSEQTVEGKTLHQVSLIQPITAYAKESQKALSPKEAALRPLLIATSLPVNHFYWVKEGEHLLFSTLPQPLMARWQSPATGTLQTWLDERHLNIQGATVAGNMSYRNLSQKAYYNQLAILRLLAALTETPLAIETFPVANSLSLPRYGELSLSIHNVGETLSMEFSAQNGLSDVWQALQNNYTIATIGILAAVAIPQYADYTQRAKAAYQAQLENTEKTDKTAKPQE